MKLTSSFFLTAIFIALAGTVAASSHRNRYAPALDFPLEESTPWTSYAYYNRFVQPQNIVQDGRINAERLVFLRSRLLQMEKARESLLYQEGARLSEGDKAILRHDFYPYHTLIASEVNPNLGLLLKVQEDLQKLREIEGLFDRLLIQRGIHF
ncbi:uncharacterized protein UTRI_04870 [Ustilago trichophora]|uniref:Uncharacterized protein n=1 Tax=Ustilago trichophora TaxID=86804 RepID=A0A5C3ECS1_9BASI|nr:uncharacterized protein UTRI_04870 [Ustilago trichophora]